MFPELTQTLFFSTIITLIVSFITIYLVQNDREDITEFINELKDSEFNKHNGKTVLSWYKELISNNKKFPKKVYLTKKENNYVKYFLEKCETPYPIYDFVAPQTNEFTSSLNKIKVSLIKIVLTSVKVVIAFYYSTHLLEMFPNKSGFYLMIAYIIMFIIIGKIIKAILNTTIQ